MFRVQLPQDGSQTIDEQHEGSIVAATRDNGEMASIISISCLGS